MKLTDLTKPQWDAALEAARQLAQGDVNNADDCARFRSAKARLAELLPAGVEAGPIITAAVRWDMLNSLVEAVASIPGATIQSLTGEPASAEQAAGLNQ